MAGSSENPSSFWLAKAAIAKSFANRKPPVNVDTRDSLCKIVINLYLSSCHLEAQKELLKRKGVTHVLQVGKELSPTHPAAFSYKHVPVYDLEEEDLVKYFPECFDFINAGRETGAVLVHCAAGVSRSASVVIGYLMATGGLSLEDARAAVKVARPAINPNQGFLLQLQLFQEAGCSTEGWQKWDLERFLRVRSIAYSRGDTPGSLAVAAMDSIETLMRGACELSPPVLSHEDSISPAGSPTHSSAHSGGDRKGPFFSMESSATATAAVASDQPGVALDLTPSSGPGNGDSDYGQWASPEVSPEPVLTVGVANGGKRSSKQGSAGPSAVEQGASVRGNASSYAGGLNYSLPTLPAIGGAVAGVVAAAASAIVAAGGAREASGFWRPHTGTRLAHAQPRARPTMETPAAAVVPQPTSQAASGGVCPSPILPLYRSLQRQLSADDAVPVMVPVRAAAVSVPSIGSSPVEATSICSGTICANTSNFNTHSTNSSFSLAAMHTGAAAVAGPTPLPLGHSSDSPATGPAPTRRCTTSGGVNESSSAAWPAVSHGSWPVWAMHNAAPARSCEGRGTPASSGGRDTGFRAEGLAGSMLAATCWPSLQQASSDWSSGFSRAANDPADGSHVSGGEAASRRSSCSEGLHSWGLTAAAPDSTTRAPFVTRAPHADWQLELVPQAQPQPQLQQRRIRRISQRSLEAGVPPVLSPIPSDGGCSDEAVKSDADEVSSSSGVEIGFDGRRGGSERQLQLESDLGRAPIQPRSASRRGFLRRSLSDRLQSMLAKAGHSDIGVAAKSGCRGPTHAGDKMGGGVRSSDASSLIDATGASGPTISSMIVGTSWGGSGETDTVGDMQEVGLRPKQQQPIMNSMQVSKDAPATDAATTLSPTTLHLAALWVSRDSGASSSTMASILPDPSGSDGSSRYNTTTSQLSAGGAASILGGVYPAEEGSDSPTGVVTIASGCPDGGALASLTSIQHETWSDNSVQNRSARPYDAHGAWEISRRKRWALMPILTPAGLERTPSKVPQTPIASDVAPVVESINSTRHIEIVSGAPLEAATDLMSFGMSWQESMTTLHGDAMGNGSAPAALSAALKHLVAAQALSQGGGTGAVPFIAAAAAAMPPAAPPDLAYVRSDPEIAASQTPSVCSVAGSPRSPHNGMLSDLYSQSRYSGPSLPHLISPDGADPPDQNVRVRTSSTGAKVASRLATATYADSGQKGGYTDGLAAAGRRREYSISGIGSKSIPPTASRNHGSDPCISEGEDGDESRDAESAIQTGPNLQRFSAPVILASALQTSASGLASAAMLPPADSVNSPGPPAMVAEPARSLRLSLRKPHGTSGSDIGSAAGHAHDLSRGEDGTGTPIHKRVLRSLTSFLVRSSDSPTASTSVPAGADIQGQPASDEVQMIEHGRRGTDPASRRKLWPGFGSEEGAPAAAATPQPQRGDTFDGNEGDRPMTASKGTVLNWDAFIAAPGRNYSLSNADGGTLVEPTPEQPLLAFPGDHALAPIRTVVASVPAGDPNNMSDGAHPKLPSQGWPDLGLSLWGAGRDAFGGTGATAPSNWDVGDYDEASKSGAAFHKLSRSKSSSPTCAAAATAAGQDLAWLVSTDAESFSASEIALGLGMAAGPGLDGSFVGTGAIQNVAPGQVMDRQDTVLPTGGVRTCFGFARVEAGPVEGGGACLGTAGGDAERIKEEELPEEDEDVVGLDLLPNGPFGWEPRPDAPEWHPALPRAADATAGFVSETVTEKCAVAPISELQVFEAGPAPVRGEARHFSLDGRRGDHDITEANHGSVPRAKGMRATVTMGAVPNATADHTASYMSSLVAVASAALLPAESLVLSSDARPSCATTAYSAMSTESAPFTSVQASASVGAGWLASGAASGLERMSLKDNQCWTLALLPGDAAHHQMPAGHVRATCVATTATHCSVAASADESAVANSSHAWANVRGGAAAASVRRPRSSYSGALSMLPPMSRRELEALAGAAAGAITRTRAAGGGAGPTGVTPLGVVSMLPVSSQTYKDAVLRGSLTCSHLSLPLPGIEPMVSPTQQQEQRQDGDAAAPFTSGAAGGDACAGNAIPAWGGSRSSASLLTMLSDSEPPPTKPTSCPQQADLACEHRPQQPQQPLQPKLDGLAASTPPLQLGRAAVRSSSTGSSAAAHAAAAAAGSLAADSTQTWENLRGVRQHHRQWPLQQHERQQPPALQQPRPMEIFISGTTVEVGSNILSAPPLASVAAAEAGDSNLVRSAMPSNLPGSSLAPLAAGPPPAMAGACDNLSITPLLAVAAQTSPPSPAQPELAPAESSASPCAVAMTAVRLSLSPTASSGGSSTSVHSPRAPPAVSDMMDVDPWEVDATSVPQGPAVTTPALGSPVASGLSRGRLDPSLLKPVLGRRLLPIPSPSRIIGSAAGTPRGSAGGAGASMHMPESAIPPAVEVSLARGSPFTAVDAIVHVATVASTPSPPAQAPPASRFAEPPPPLRPPPSRLHVPRVFLPQQLSPLGNKSAERINITIPSKPAIATAEGPEGCHSGVASGGGASFQSTFRSSGGSRVERPADSPGNRSGTVVRSLSAVCGSGSDSEDGAAVTVAT